MIEMKEAIAQEEEGVRLRGFKFTQQVPGKFGFSDHCVGYEGAFVGRRRQRTTMCRQRLEEEFMKSDVGKQKR